MGSAPSEWERFAARDPLYYVDPALGDGADLAEFIAAGDELVELMLDWAGDLPARERALEIGCGVGRNTAHLAGRFARVDGVDVSPTMVRLAEEHGMPDNVELHVTDGRDLALFEAGTFDLVFSHLVFQHVPDAAVLAGYVGEIARVLRPGGRAVVQFDTREMSLGARVARALPDRLLPRRYRRGMRRHPRSAAEVRGWVSDAGLEVEAERGVGESEHWLCLGRTRAATGE